MLNRAEIKAKAKDSFMQNYGITIGTMLLFGLIFGAISLIGALSQIASSLWSIGMSRAAYIAPFSPLTSLLSMGSILLLPLGVGLSYFMVKVYRGNRGDLGEAFHVSFSNYGRKLGGMLWMGLFIALWWMLFIIPGIIKMFSYSMTPYILGDCPNVKAKDALKLSMKMTDGYKSDIFVMQLSFIGWGLLSAITAGIVGILYAGPYYMTSMAGMYDELKNNALAKGVITAEELA